jgi:hypothetical protein
LLRNPGRLHSCCPFEESIVKAPAPYRPLADLSAAIALVAACVAVALLGAVVTVALPGVAG